MATTLLGANGKLGSMLAAFARSNGVAWRSQARSGTSDVIWSGDMTAEGCDRVFQHGGTIINMIGYTGSDADLLEDVNVRFVHDLLHKAAETGVAHVVLASSAATYGAGGDAPFAEDVTLNPLTSYGISKQAMEHVALDFAEHHSAPALTIARIGNVAGADALTAAAKRHIAEGIPMPLHRFDDGTAPVRSYIGPRDLFHAMNALSVPHDGLPQIVNVVHPQPVPLDAVLAAYRDHVLPDLTWADTPAPAGSPQRVTLSTDKLQQFVNFSEYPDPAQELGLQLAEYLSL